MAVKCLSKEKLQAQMSDFLQEAIVMHSLDHPHVVHLFGVVLVSDSIMLVGITKGVVVYFRLPKLRFLAPVRHLYFI